MDTRIDQLQTGWGAYGRDGDKIGEIEEIGPNYVLVTKGLIFVTDLYIPTQAIEKVDADEGRIYLNVDKSAVEDQGWNEPPTGDAYSSPDSEGAVAGLGYTGRDEAMGGATVTNTYQTGATGSTVSDTDFDSGTTTDSDRIRVPVHEEELRAERTSTEAGEVRVGKKVVEEQRQLDVPVTRDEVQIRRVSTDRPATGSEDAFTDGDTIRVPVRAEQVEVTKEARVVEEIEISKRPVTETQRVTDTVRREEVQVDETGNVLTGAGASMSGTGSELNDPSASGMRGTADDLSDDADISRR